MPPGPSVVTDLSVIDDTRLPPAAAATAAAMQPRDTLERVSPVLVILVGHLLLGVNAAGPPAGGRLEGVRAGGLQMRPWLALFGLRPLVGELLGGSRYPELLSCRRVASRKMQFIMKFFPPIFLHRP